MKKIASDAQRHALAETVRQAYMEIFPTASVESKLDVLEPESYVAITCSPSKGVEETLAMAERLALRGFKVVPHVAAKMVKDETHLREIMARLDDMPIESLFVPGGDAATPAGKYSTALELLRDIAEFEHRFTNIGIAAHPEGHPGASRQPFGAGRRAARCPRPAAHAAQHNRLEPQPRRRHQRIYLAVIHPCTRTV